MFNYTVKPGEVLTSIAYQHQTTVDVLKVDNSFLQKNEKLLGGEVLRIRTIDEYAEDRVSGMEKLLRENDELKKKAVPNNKIIPEKNIQIHWGNYKIVPYQTGVVYVDKDTYFYKKDGKLDRVKKEREVKKNSTWRAYGDVTIGGIEYFLVGNNLLIEKKYSYFMEVPNEVKREVDDALGKDPKDTSTTAPLPIKPSPIKPLKTPTLKKSDFDIPHYRQPGYRRTRLQVTNVVTSDTSLIELRVIHFGETRSSDFGTSKTNEGWAVNIGGAGLTQLTLSGYLLDTAANTEVKDFKDFYDKNIAPISTQKAYQANLITILHKNIEYKGFVTNASFQDASDRPLLQMLTISFMVLSHKNLTASDSIANKMVIDRKGIPEEQFLSDINNMLTNPITGKFSKDYE